MGRPGAASGCDWGNRLGSTFMEDYPRPAAALVQEEDNKARLWGTVLGFSTKICKLKKGL